MGWAGLRTAGCCPALAARSLCIVKSVGIPVVVAINRFETDTDNELQFLADRAREMGADGAVISDVFAHGSAGGKDLAEAVVKAADKPSTMRLLYPDEMSIKDKIRTLATRVYGADDVEYMPEAERKIKLYTDLGFGHLPICMAKTHLSYSHDPNKKGVPKGYKFPIRDVRLSAGAGYLYPLAGEMMTMPGLDSSPAAMRVDLDEKGLPKGLF